ncbi:MAG TPA: S1C family serine protease [Acidimicrobiales bacterium]
MQVTLQETMEVVMALVDELPGVAGAVSEKVGRSVVRVGRDGRGSGLVIGEGQVLTSAHNLRGGEITVAFADGRSAVGTVAAADADADIAVVNVDTAGSPAVPWDPQIAGRLSLGTPVLGVALAAGGGVRVTFGTVSSVGRAFRGPRGRLISDGIEHSATLGRGSSGGPLLDFEGRLVGINTHRTGDGLYLAVPAGTGLRAKVDSLSKGEAPTRRRLGVGLAPSRMAARLRSAVGLPARDGVLVREVASGSPAAEAGLTRGDLIVAAGGSAVTTTDELLAAVDAVGDDGILRLTVVRGVEDVEVVVRFAGAAEEV